MSPRVLITLIYYGFTVFMESASQSILLSSALVFPFLSTKLGLTTLYRLGFSGHLVIQTSYALMNVFARRSGRVDGFVIALLAVQLAFVNFVVMTFSKL
jgi:hypothetical protein